MRKSTERAADKPRGDLHRLRPAFRPSAPMRGSFVFQGARIVGRPHVTLLPCSRRSRSKAACAGLSVERTRFSRRPPRTWARCLCRLADGAETRSALWCAPPELVTSRAECPFREPLGERTPKGAGLILRPACHSGKQISTGVFKKSTGPHGASSICPDSRRARLRDTTRLRLNSDGGSRPALTAQVLPSAPAGCGVGPVSTAGMVAAARVRRRPQVTQRRITLQPLLLATATAAPAR